jgi:hypothetical protein
MKRKSQGFAKRLEVYFYDWSDEAHFRSSDDRFERPLKDIYKFILCHSYRDKGKNKKYQYVILSTGYYWLVDEMFCLWDYFDVRAGSNREKKLQEFSNNVGMSIEDLFHYTYDKIEKIRQPLVKEYHKTKEYKTNKKNDEIISKYWDEKRKFDNKYGSDTYAKCYNIFGELWNETKLNELKEQYKKNQEYQERSRNTYSNYNNYGYGSYSSSSVSTPTYTDKEQQMLKTIYKRMAITFHPDNKNGDTDIMKFINSKLKEDWGI